MYNTISQPTFETAAHSGKLATSDDGHWAESTVFYHVYPLGLTGAPSRADAESGIQLRLNQLHDWIPYWQELGIGAIWLGPVQASMSHGYDPVDYFAIDPRLGDREHFADFVAACHRAGIRVVLDGVFNHVGRGFFAFAQLCADPEHSPYRDWFHLSHGSSPDGDPFEYACWEGHHELVKLNLADPGVRAYLFGAVSHWIEDYGIDGLRLDVAYCLDPDFVAALAAHCRRQKPGFWLMGEIIHGDYRPLLGQLDSVSNYECHKGLWSSHKDRNCFEIAHSLQRLFGPEGLCQGRALYNFADNHDVDRVASRFDEPGLLFPLYLLLMSMPGIPSLYQGSELGLQGIKQNGDDRFLRPAIQAEWAFAQAQASGLYDWIHRLIALRSACPALQRGDYRAAAIRNEQFAFTRQSAADQACVVAINLRSSPASLHLDSLALSGWYRDALEPGEMLWLEPGTELTLPALGGRILIFCQP